MLASSRPQYPSYDQLFEGRSTLLFGVVTSTVRVPQKGSSHRLRHAHLSFPHRHLHWNREVRSPDRHLRRSPPFHPLRPKYPLEPPFKRWWTMSSRHVTHNYSQKNHKP